MIRRSVPSERGSITVEVAILGPALLVLLALLVMAGRVQTNGAGIEQAARAAARDASIARTADAARAAAESAAARELADTGCLASDVRTDTSGFATITSQVAAVTVTVTCTVPLSDLAAPGIPGHRTVTASATSPIDRYRER